MAQDYLDRALSVETEIIPSIGFRNSVMQRVRSEVSVPQPIPFPWKRALPSLLLLIVGMSLFIFVSTPSSNSEAAGLCMTHLSAILISTSTFCVYWVLGGVLLAWACVKVSMEIV